jgi:hypothetical protein
VKKLPEAEPARTTVTAKVSRSEALALRAIAHRNCRTPSQEIRSMIRERVNVGGRYP